MWIHQCHVGFCFLNLTFVAKVIPFGFFLQAAFNNARTCTPPEITLKACGSPRIYGKTVGHSGGKAGRSIMCKKIH